MDEALARQAAQLIERVRGIPVAQAVQTCEAAGFVVHAHPPDAILTADFRPRRIRLTAADGRVQSGSYG